MDTRENRKRKAEEERQGDFSKKTKKIVDFRRNAFLIIDEMVKMNSEHTTNTLLDEILHSIFFLGKLNDPEFSPESIVSDPEDIDLLNMLRECFPRPFQLYSSQLPKRGPLSCVLDMIIHKTGRENEDKIIERLRELTDQLKEGYTNQLVSSTICVSQSNPPKSTRYYGVSMCTSGPVPGRIMVGASCLSSWDSCVAAAVMTYYPNKTKKDYFDGTIELPQQVRCEAFSLSHAKSCQSKKMPPCRSCANLFGLTTSDDQEWPYGACAEAESLSNLLKEEQARLRNVGDREKAESCLLTELKRCLKEMKFKWDKGEHFYTPQWVKS